MKTRMLISFAVIAVALAGASVQAQSGRLLAANIPFNFYVKDRAFPAGPYTVEPIQVGGSDALRIQSADGHITAFVPVRCSRARANQVVSTLVFKRFGEQYFLSQVPGLEERAMYALPKSHREDELANGGGAARQQTVSVIESRR